MNLRLYGPARIVALAFRRHPGAEVRRNTGPYDRKRDMRRIHVFLVPSFVSAMFLAAPLVVGGGALPVDGQAGQEMPGNLLWNAHADDGAAGWRAFGDATVERVSGNACFVIRNNGRFEQMVLLPGAANGGFLVVAGRGSSERINPGGGITGLPYLYGLVYHTDHKHIVGYLTQQKMLGEPRAPDEWTMMWGIFPVPEGAESVTLSLQQAEAKGVPQNGSAARFDDLVMVIAATKDNAETLVRALSEHGR
jgi:hypothetical protein